MKEAEEAFNRILSEATLINRYVSTRSNTEDNTCLIMAGTIGNDKKGKSLVELSGRAFDLAEAIIDGMEKSESFHKAIKLAVHFYDKKKSIKNENPK